MKINHPEVPFILGHKLGELSREIELVIETSQREDRREKHKIKVIRVYESMKYVHDELMQLGTSEEIQKDFTLYLKNLAKKYSEIKRKIDDEQGKVTKDEMIVSKFKRKISRKNRDLHLYEVKELDLKLKILKDKLKVP